MLTLEHAAHTKQHHIFLADCTHHHDMALTKQIYHALDNIAHQPCCLGVLLAGALLGTIATTYMLQKRPPSS